jgi:TRAP-type C4-dicarboxylate transport system permease small subunit
MSEHRSILRTVLVVVGGGALLGAMAIDGFAVVGRHVGLPLLGSIEAVQAAVLVAGCVALLVATQAGRHARVHLLVDRLPAQAATLLRRAGFLLGALLFAALAVASAWIAIELWPGHEESEWLHIRYAPLRAMTVLFCAWVAGAFLAAAFRRTDP